VNCKTAGNTYFLVESNVTEILCKSVSEVSILLLLHPVRNKGYCFIAAKNEQNLENNTTKICS
jgi:hypothetical protein